jgi:hypothetical protein
VLCMHVCTAAVLVSATSQQQQQPARVPYELQAAAQLLSACLPCVTPCALYELQQV